MPNPLLVMWLLVAPFLLAIVDAARTISAVFAGRKSSPAPGPWSKALHLGN